MKNLESALVELMISQELCPPEFTEDVAADLVESSRVRIIEHSHDEYEILIDGIHDPEYAAIMIDGMAMEIECERNEPVYHWLEAMGIPTELAPSMLNMLEPWEASAREGRDNV